MWAWVCCGTLLLKNIFDFGRLMALPKSLIYCKDVFHGLALYGVSPEEKILSSASNKWDMLGAPLQILHSWMALLLMDCLMRADSPSVHRINR